MPEVLMPRLSDTMAEGTLSQWVKHEGDQVRKGDILAVIETDKAAMEMGAYDEGVLTRILVEEGQSVPIGTPIAVIGAEPAPPAPGAQASAAVQPMPEAQTTSAAQPSSGTQVPAAQAPPAAIAPLPSSAPAAARASAPAPPAAAPVPAPASLPFPPPQQPSHQVRTSLLARKLARQHGIDLIAVAGTGLAAASSAPTSRTRCAGSPPGLPHPSLPCLSLPEPRLRRIAKRCRCPSYDGSRRSASPRAHARPALPPHDRGWCGRSASVPGPGQSARTRGRQDQRHRPAH